jgi:hypothetical protein
MEGRIKLLNQILRGNDRWPMSRIKAAFTAEEVRAWCAPTDLCNTARRVLMPLYLSIDVAWCMEYLTWIVDELGISLDGPVFAENGPRSNRRAIDCVLGELGGIMRVPCALFLLKRGAKTGFDWNFILLRECERLAVGNVSEPIIKALLDKGCFPSVDSVAMVPQVGDWAVARMRTKEVCLLVLALGKRRRTQWSAYIAYDVWKLIAQQMWEQRWDMQLWRRAAK